MSVAPTLPSLRAATRVRARRPAPGSWTWSLGVVLGLRVLLGAVAWVAGSGAGLAQGDLRLPIHWALGPLVGPWMRFDALHYAGIATWGYRPGTMSAAFFPLYPAVTHAVGLVTGADAGVAGLLVSTAALVVALVLLHRLVSGDAGAQIADRATVYLLLAPTAVFLLAPYSESLFLLVSVATFLAARRRRFVLAAGLATLGALGRPQGVLLVIPLAVEMAAALRDRGASPLPWRRPREMALLALPVAATACFYVYARAATGLSPLQAQAGWGGHLVAPWSPVLDTLAAVGRGYGGEILNVAALLGLAAALPLMWRRLPRSYTLYSGATLLLLAVRENGAGNPMQSVARFVGVVFPVFVVLALASRSDRRIHLTVMVLFPVLMLDLAVSYLGGGFVG